ncbi:MAG: ABC transporter permease, partial [Rubrivivax sp.]
MNAVATPGAAAAAPAPPSRGYWASVGVRVLRDPVFWVAAFVVLALLAMAFFGPWIAPADPQASSMLSRLKPIGTEGHPLGTDELGRDLLSRLIVGARLSLFMGITPV